MKENNYDNQAFFEKYSQMDRSKKGLEGAGEWQTLKQMLPDFSGKSVLDLGCGYGWHCIYAAEQGAASVIGVDLSEKMLESAREKTHFSQVEYIQAGIEDITFPENSFDIVISSLALHYVPSFEAVAANVQKFLKSDGEFIFSVEHPIFTAEGKQQWLYAEDGTIRHFPVDNYFYEGKRSAEFLGEEVTKYHKTLTTYIDGLLVNGFQLQRLVEPMPPENMMSIPGMKDEMRRPMMLIISAKNQK
ncbi:class I SAM-dependent methyltransferase [Enterococcus larvae]|uniref:class I SAM-dependent methyltransferase n=1 Tax=Enterococcus larvae TaxID=2794352 RepID=UPI003F419029